MIIRVRIKNCELYIGNLSKCIKCSNLENLKIMTLKPYKENVLLVRDKKGIYFTFEDYIYNRNNPIKKDVEKVGDLSVSNMSLKKVDDKWFDNRKLVLRKR